MFEVNKKGTRTMSMAHWRRSSVFIVNFEHILHPFCSVSFVEHEQVNVCWLIFSNKIDQQSMIFS